MISPNKYSDSHLLCSSVEDEGGASPSFQVSSLSPVPLHLSSIQLQITVHTILQFLIPRRTSVPAHPLLFAKSIGLIIYGKSKIVGRIWIPKISSYTA